MYKIQLIVFNILINFTAILLGFFLAINLSTILGQTGDWGVLSSGLFAAAVETVSRIVYKTKKNLFFFKESTFSNRLNRGIALLNNLKIGILYGFFVESFKLGS